MSEYITMDEVKDVVQRNAEVVNLVRHAVGFTSLNEVARSVEMNWASFANALERGDQLNAKSRGRARKGKFSGLEALEHLTETIKPIPLSGYADILETVARHLREQARQ